jgi:hypothetical protein
MAEKGVEEQVLAMERLLSFRICLLEEIQETKKNEGKCVIFLISTCMYTLPVI